MKKLYSTREAAEYLSMTESAVRYHVHVAGNLQPQKVGHSLVFTREQLDRFVADRRPRGRPRKEEVE